MEIIEKITSLLRDNVSLKNPFSEEQLNHIKEQGQEVLRDFGILYSKNVGLALFEKFKAEFETEYKPNWRLQHRKLESVPSYVQNVGYCYVQRGEGPGAFAKMKKQFLVERQNFSIDVYSNEQEYYANRKPKYTIQTAGYKLFRNVESHYRWEIRQLISGLAFTEVEVAKLMKFSTHSWALFHPQRMNYVFQINDPKSNTPSYTKDQEQERRRWVDFMEMCTKKCQPRDTKSVLGKAFQSSCKSINKEILYLASWKDDGTEDEMLVDMLMEACLPDFRDGFIKSLIGPSSLRLAIWYKVRGLIHTAVSAIVGNGWKLIQRGANELLKKLEPLIEKLMRKVIDAKNKLEEIIKEKLLNPVGKLLAKHVAPFIEPILRVFERPMYNGFDHGKKLFNSQIAIENLPGNAQQRDGFLDSIPRTKTYVFYMQCAADELVAPLHALKSQFKEVFMDMDVDDLRFRTEHLFVETVDAAIFSVEVRLERGAPKHFSLKDEILRDYDHDVMLARSDFVCEVVREIFVNVVQKLMSPLTDPLIEEFNMLIPKELYEFMDIQEILDRFVEFMVGEPITIMVEKIYPKPATNQSMSNNPSNGNKQTDTKNKLAETTSKPKDTTTKPAGTSGKKPNEAAPADTGRPKMPHPPQPELPPDIPATTPPAVPGKSAVPEQNNQGRRFVQNPTPTPAPRIISDGKKEMPSVPEPPKNKEVINNNNLAEISNEVEEEEEYENWDDTAASLAMWSGDLSRGKEIMMSLSATEGAYMLRSSRDLTGYTLCTICHGKHTKFRILTDKLGEYTLVKKFSSLDKIIDYYTDHPLPHKDTKLTQPYCDLTGTRGRMTLYMEAKERR